MFVVWMYKLGICNAIINDLVKIAFFTIIAYLIEYSEIKYFDIHSTKDTWIWQILAFGE